jgi:hypothetical protein
MVQNFQVVRFCLEKNMGRSALTPAPAWEAISCNSIESTEAKLQLSGEFPGRRPNVAISKS